MAEQIVKEIEGDGVVKGLREVINLESYLIPHSQNRKNLNALIEVVKAKEIVSFIGAGLSNPLGICDWAKLMEVLVSYAQKNLGFSGDLKDEPDKWPLLAENIFKVFKEKNRLNEFFNIISTRMEPQWNTTTLTLVKLVIAIGVHLTTNFDNSIENAYIFLAYLADRFKKPDMKKDFVPHYVPDFGDYHDRGEKGHVYYLHGNRNRNIYIIRESDYQCFYPSVSGATNHNRALEELLKYHYKNNTILFVGFSFQDDYVKRFFFKLALEIQNEIKATTEWYSQAGETYRSPELKHFLIIDDSNREFRELGEKIYSTYQTSNIYPIVYQSGFHIFLEKLFEQLPGGLGERG